MSIIRIGRTLGRNDCQADAGNAGNAGNAGSDVGQWHFRLEQIIAGSGRAMSPCCMESAGHTGLKDFATPQRGARVRRGSQWWWRWYVLRMYWSSRWANSGELRENWSSRKEARRARRDDRLPGAQSW